MPTAGAPERQERGGHPARVAVCIVTYRRPRLLADLLQSLRFLRFQKAPAPDIRLVVVDSDPAGSARETVDAASAALPWPIRYTISPDRSISVARNTAVDAALAGSADFVAFVDDDEVVTPEWLDELLAAQTRYDANAVCGPVLPRYAENVPPWAVRSRLLEPDRYPSGQVLGFGMTGNALIAASAFPAGQPAFDPGFGSSGAEDTHFFMRMTRSGGKVVWADEAVAHEHTPAARGTIGWMLRRAFRVGNCYVYCERALGTSRSRMVPRAGAALARVLVAGALLLPGAFFGRAGLVRALRVGAHGVGTLAALAGYRYEQYQAPPQVR